MAAKSGPRANSRSQAIREYLAQHPDDGPSVVQKALAEKGITVSAALVSNIKYNKKGKGAAKVAGKKRRGRPPGSTNGDAVAAKGKGRYGEKAQAVRDEFKRLGLRTRTSEVLKSLAARGVKVSAAQVSKIKARLKSRRRRRAARLAGVGSVGVATSGRRASNEALSVSSLLAAKSLVDKLGGVAQVKRALEVLDQLK